MTFFPLLLLAFCEGTLVDFPGLDGVEIGLAHLTDHWLADLHISASAASRIRADII
jgi:hypothetical protein